MTAKAGTSNVQEEQFLLRFVDPSLAERVKKALREETHIEDGGLQLNFPDCGRVGQMQLEGVNYRVDLLDLPTVVESYKTLDDINLVKTGDVGQVLLVGGNTPPSQTESLNGVTAPMQNARKRHFKQVPKVDPQVVSKVEADLFGILRGHAPLGYEFYDVEEEYVVDPETGAGSWQKCKPAPTPAPTPAAGAIEAGGQPVQPNAETQEGAAAGAGGNEDTPAPPSATPDNVKTPKVKKPRQSKAKPSNATPT
ncbi:hypothetical protein CEUSTIGMA_g5028.t1 [Chlamydomonas eustigma]|uniref:TAFII55 protein conserved region domain-containing protein n=1 Tax=Chlamydomonas eustigma TaxID=1157962 RepID=A0A250X3C5_9CHLO|nr:hypothetical protein CEUSTIGMA_g5028.t1 [Chlamydomonas eustigma]|eukprot:GAX77584.1 hypothetical protein CEUSTIGMA_g5028.t1 [Chlamydomonas eustigma]